jgi:dTMP kinase
MFICFEGVDGSGKSTQIDRLGEWFAEKGQSFIRCREPGTTELGKKIRTLLLEDHSTPIHLRAEALLFMTSRAQLVDEVVSPALQQGTVVICDRFLLSTVVYQGYAGGLDLEQLWSLGKFATAGIMPDITFVMDLPVEQSIARLGNQRDRLESRPLEYFKKVRDGFLVAAQQFSENIVVVDATHSIDDIQRTIQNTIDSRLKQ